MLERFPLFAPPPPRPPGRCPGCRRLALVPEVPLLDGAAPPDDWPHHCTRCGARYRRRFGRSWEKVPEPGDFGWFDEPEAAAPSPTRPRRFRIRTLMIVILWVALNLAPLSGMSHDEPARALVTWVGCVTILNVPLLWFARFVKPLSPPPSSADPRGSC